MEGSVRVQVPATEDYAANNGISLYSAGDSGANLIESGNDGGSLTFYHITWKWDSDLSTTDGFTGHSWFAGKGTLSTYQDEAAITTAVQNGLNITEVITNWAANSSTTLEDKNAWIDLLITSASGCIS